jgi:hypothetical protein
VLKLSNIITEEVEENFAKNDSTSPFSVSSIYNDAADLPLVNLTLGDIAFVQSSNTLYFSKDTGWYKIGLINQSPTITAGGDASYELNSDGTPTVITLQATDPEDLPITWSHTVTSGALEDTTVTNVDNVFTITPGETAATFDLTFTASDGINIDTSASSFTLAFVPDWAAATLLHTIDNPNAYGESNSDAFGWSVAISGDYAIVGATNEADGAVRSGIAYIFNAVTGSIIHTLRNPESNKYDNYFGYSVAMSGNYAIVSAANEETSSGKAYIYNVTTGALVHTLDNPNDYDDGYKPAHDHFGISVAISGNYAIVGAPYENWTGGQNSGKAYIFDVTTGLRVHTLDNPNDYGTPSFDEFGYSVAMSGNYAIAGAPFEGDGGKAYIFDVTTGLRVHTLDNPNDYGTVDGDFFGKSVAISGNYAAVGAPNEDKPYETNSGVVYVFNVTTGALVHTLVNQNIVGNSINDSFGSSISMDNYVIFVGAPAEDVGGSGGGGIYMYDVTTGALILPSIFYNNGQAAGDWLGKSVSVSGSYAIAGAPYQSINGGYGGACKIFKAG